VQVVQGDTGNPGKHVAESTLERKLSFVDSYTSQRTVFAWVGVKRDDAK
jgi:hypothetical protein